MFNNRLTRLAGVFLFHSLMLVSPLHADDAATPGVEEVGRLLEYHPAKKIDEDQIADLQSFQATLDLGSTRVKFIIPGFGQFGCSQCHKARDLAEKTAERLKRTLAGLQNNKHLNQPVPIKQYIIQPYTGKLLQPGQLAHATFDTIRVFPGSVIIDSKVYDGQTHLHEALHLSQPFLGHVNELEAYGLNVRADPRFLLLNYPYFADAIRAYRLPELAQMIRDWYARPVRENLSVPQEVQWFLAPFDEEALARLRDVIAEFFPVLDEVSVLYRAHPEEAAYWSERTGIRSLVFDLAALKILGLPPVAISPEEMTSAMKIFEQQMRKDDNTRLGYVIDRKTESMLTLKYGKGPKDGVKQLAVYFSYLKKTFFNDNNEIVWPMDSPADFENFVKRQIEGLEAMSEFEGMTPIEREGAKQIVEQLKLN